MTTPLHIGADLDTMLRFYHDLGKIVYFGSLSQEKRALNDMVILDPQMLVDIFKEIITIAKPKPSVSHINSSKKVLQFKFDLLYITLFSVFSTKIGIIRKLV